MNQYHQTQAEIRYSLDKYRCHICGKRATQSAHRLSKTKVNLKKYGGKTINHNSNLVSVCDLACNKAVDIGNVNKHMIKTMISIIETCRDTKRILYTDEIDTMLFWQA